MSRPPGRDLRIIITWCFIVLAALGVATLFRAIFDPLRNRKDDYREITADAEPLIRSIYQHWKANGSYPAHLSELGPIPGETSRKDGQRYDNDTFCAEHCWTYMSRGNVDSPICFLDIGWHRELVYDFAPSHRNGFPAEANEGWVLTDEGNYRYLRSIDE